MGTQFAGFIEIPTSLLVEKVDLKMAPLPPVAFYAVKSDLLTCIREASKSFSALALCQFQTVWIRESDLPKLGTVVDEILKNPKSGHAVPLESRMKLMTQAAASAAEECFQNPSEETLNRSNEVVGSFVKLLLQDPRASRFLLRLSAQSSHEVRHAISTSTQCVLLARVAGIENERELQDIGLAGLLHDIGKTLLPPAIANHKEAECKGENLAAFQKHPELGYKLLKGFPQISDRTARAVLEHHEYSDGTGYPNRKRLEDLSQASRILCLCNLFQNQCVDAKNERTVSQAEAFEKLRTRHLSKADPALVKILAQLFDPD